MPRADLLEQRGLGDIALVLPQGGKQVAGKGHALAVGCSAAAPAWAAAGDM
jgi:hypothetical protein